MQLDEKKKRHRGKPEYVPDDPLLSANQAAAERGQAISTFWRDVRAGRVPPAYYVTPRCPRWRLSHIRAALEETRVASKSSASPNQGGR